jgi:hypothetical protein
MLRGAVFMWRLGGLAERNTLWSARVLDHFAAAGAACRETAVAKSDRSRRQNQASPGGNTQDQLKLTPAPKGSIKQVSRTSLHVLRMYDRTVACLARLAVDGVEATVHSIAPSTTTSGLLPKARRGVRDRR